jgi:hypothetical protein
MNRVDTVLLALYGPIFKPTLPIFALKNHMRSEWFLRIARGLIKKAIEMAQ